MEFKQKQLRSERDNLSKALCCTVNVIPDLVQLNHLKIHLYKTLYQYINLQPVFSIQLLSFAWFDDIFN